MPGARSKRTLRLSYISVLLSKWGGWVGGGVKTKACYIPADPLPPSATKCQTKDGGRGSGGGQSGLNNGLFSASGGASPTGGDGGAKAQPAQARAGLATG